MRGFFQWCRKVLLCLFGFEGKFVLLRQYRHAIQMNFSMSSKEDLVKPGVSVEENVKKIQEELNAEVTEYAASGTGSC